MKKILFLLSVALLVGVLLAGCSSVEVTGPSSSSNDEPTKSSHTTTPQWGVQKKTTNCTVRGPLQDPDCTPGAIFPNATKDQICQPGYARSVRDVPTSEKNQVYASYGIASRSPGQYEVDHLVSLELGGSNEISNLWPESATPKPGFHEKDKVENYLHDQVCSGAMTLKDAQVAIATDWISVYNKMPKQ